MARTKDLHVLCTIAETNEFSSHRLKFTATIVTLEDFDSYSGPRTLQPWYDRDEGLAGIEVHAKASPTRDVNFAEITIAYYDRTSIGFYDLDRMAKAARQILNRMDAVARRFGQPIGIAQYVTRFGDAINAASMLRPPEPHEVQGEYITMTPDDLARWVDRRAFNFGDEYGPGDRED